MLLPKHVTFAAHFLKKVSFILSKLQKAFNQRVYSAALNRATIRLILKAEPEHYQRLMQIINIPVTL